MIQFADEYTTPSVCRMWKTCFGDIDEFINLYFQQKYKPENTLIYIVRDEVVASLQMVSYTITFYGQEVPFYYLSGLCTLPEYRRRGYMADLIEESHKVMKNRGIPLSILVPAEESLFGFYEKFGYERVFDKSEEPILSLKRILDTFPDIEDAYRAFNLHYINRDFCVQKKLSDFKAIVEEYKLDGCPEKYNLAGMARIIDDFHLLKIYANYNHSVKVKIKVKSSFHPSEDVVYAISNGVVERVKSTSFDIEADIRFLCRLLFGYKTGELKKTYRDVFPEHHPIMNLMLE